MTTARGRRCAARAVVLGQGGNDTITVASQVNRDGFLYGNAGNDRITVGNGRAVALGGDGDDVISTANGRDALIGGRGADNLSGGNEDDLMIGGATIYDDYNATNVVELVKLRNEWSRTNLGYAARVNRLLGVPPGSPFVFRTGGSNPNVFADTAQGRLTGGNGNDWFMGLTTSITDRKSSETLTQLFTD